MSKAGNAIDVRQAQRLQPSDLKSLQSFLKQTGFYSGKIDGLYGPVTDHAIAGFNAANSTYRLIASAETPTVGSKTIPDFPDNPYDTGNWSDAFASPVAVARKLFGASALRTDNITVDLSKGVLRFARTGELVPGTTILGGDFIENEPASKLAKEYKKSPGMMMLRGKAERIDLENQWFYGILNGRLEVGNIGRFPDDVVVTPARLSGIISNAALDVSNSQKRVRFFGPDGKPVFNNIDFRGKLVVFDLKNPSDAVFIHGNPPHILAEIERFKVSRNISALGYLALDNGRFRDFTSNAKGLTASDYQQYGRSDLSRRGGLGYNLIHDGRTPERAPDDESVQPRYQTLGDIRFDSNKAIPSNDGSHWVVKDIHTGQDFGVVRNDDGSYRWYSSE